jgi:hypothetical protein
MYKVQQSLSNVFVYVVKTQCCQLKLLKCLEYKSVNRHFTILKFNFHCRQTSVLIFVTFIPREYPCVVGWCLCHGGALSNNKQHRDIPLE